VLTCHFADSGRSGSGYTSKVHIRERYHIVGFISSGTYGRVYKALGKNGKKGEFAIKKLVQRIGHFCISVLTNELDSNPIKRGS
jgi:hypothetical protein